MCELNESKLDEKLRKQRYRNGKEKIPRDWQKDFTNWE